MANIKAPKGQIFVESAVMQYAKYSFEKFHPESTWKIKIYVKNSNQ